MAKVRAFIWKLALTFLLLAAGAGAAFRANAQTTSLGANQWISPRLEFSLSYPSDWEIAEPAPRPEMTRSATSETLVQLRPTFSANSPIVAYPGLPRAECSVGALTLHLSANQAEANAHVASRDAARMASNLPNATIQAVEHRIIDGVQVSSVVFDAALFRWYTTEFILAGPDGAVPYTLWCIVYLEANPPLGLDAVEGILDSLSFDVRAEH